MKLKDIIKPNVAICLFVCVAFSIIIFHNYLLFNVQNGDTMPTKGPVQHYFRKDDKKISRKSRMESHTYFIAVNFYNSAVILESFIPELKLLLNKLGPYRCYVSIWENDSTDGTQKILHALEIQLTKMGVKNTIVTETATLVELCKQSGAVECLTPNMFKHGVRDANANTRIAMMAYFRNKPLQPLYKSFEIATTSTVVDNNKKKIPSTTDHLFPLAENNDGTKVLFFNDIYFSHYDVIKLIDTNKMNYNLACALDFEHFQVYDLWVLRDMNGLIVHPFFPYFWDSDSYWKMLLGKPIQVYSCWNGLVVFDASVLHGGSNTDDNNINNNKTSSSKPIRFRTWVDFEKRAPLPQSRNIISKKDLQIYEENVFHFPDCAASECYLFSKDLWDSGYKKIFINPSVRVDYDLTQRNLRLFLSPIVNFATGLLWILKGPKYVDQKNEYSHHISADSNNKMIEYDNLMPPTNVRCGIHYATDN